MSPRWVYAALVAYVLGFALFPPRVFLIVDEERYVSQALAFSRGIRVITADTSQTLPVSPANVVTDYPPGTSLLQSVFVAIGGWRAAALASVLALIVATLITMRWLREHDRHPAFALIVPGFLGTLFFARIGMSDVPTTALVALALWLLFRTTDTDRFGSFLAGLAVGAIPLFREPPLLLVAPVALGAIVRKRCVPWALIAGGIAGMSLRLIAYEALLGTAFFVRDPVYEFFPRNALFGVPMYGAILLVMLPGGALLPFWYRGPRRLELLAGLGSYVTLFVFFGYDAVRDNGAVKGMVLASRYMIPTLPILAFMAADVVPRAADRVFRANPGRALAIAWAAAIGVIAGALAIHPLARREEVVPLAIVRAIYGATREGVPVITNTRASLKYLSPSYGLREIIPSYDLRPDSVAALTRRFREVDVVLLDRSDSQMFRDDAQLNARFLTEVTKRCRVQPVSELGGGRGGRGGRGEWAHLRILRLTGCG